MTPTEKGAFCQRCAKNLVDFTSKTSAEIKATFMEMAGQQVCGRINPEQIDNFNADMRTWERRESRKFQSMLVFSLVVVFGLSLFSCSSDKEKKTILKMQETAQQAWTESENATPAKVEIQTVDKAKPALPTVAVLAPPDPIYYIQEKPDSLYQKLDEVHVKVDLWQLERRGVVGIMHIREDDCHCVPEELIEYDENGIQIPKVFASKAYPNPASVQTTLELKLPEGGFTEIELYDLSGKFIQAVHSGELARGTRSFTVQVTDLPTGMYLFAIRSKKYSETVKVVKI